jgi:ABC-type metal ion transport system substrate-binding protein
VQSGVSLHAWISTNGIFCNGKSMLAAVNDEKKGSPLKEDSFHENASVIVYPNPTTGLCKLKPISFKDDASISIEIFNIWGSCIYRSENHAVENKQLDISHYQPGMYILRVMIGDKLEIVKIIKQ